MRAAPPFSVILKTLLTKVTVGTGSSLRMVKVAGFGLPSVPLVIVVKESETVSLNSARLSSVMGMVKVNKSLNGAKANAPLEAA